MLARITSTIFWLLIGILCIAMFPIAVLIWIITWPFDRRLFLLHKFTCFWAGFFTWTNPHWSVSVTGTENVNRKQPYVIVSNHLSLVDIPAAFRLWIHFKWVSKAENFRIPFVGWNMSMNRYIKLYRGSNRSNAQMMKDCERALKAGSSVFIFPEGTRSSNGTVGNFRRGAFELAKRTQLPVLPIVIEGSEAALPKRGLVLRGFHRIQMKVLPPISVESFADENADQLAVRTRDLIRSEHEALSSERRGK